MSTKDKESKTFEKLKQFFRVNKGGSLNFRSSEVFVLTNEKEKEIGPDSPVNHRVKALKELSESVICNRLEDYAIEKLSVLLKDLLHRDVEKEHRHAVLSFFRCLVQGQYDKLGEMRRFFFRIVQSHDVDEDIPQRLELFQSLTENGKDILYLEQDFGHFLVTWMSAINAAGKTAEFLSLLVNAIKYNAAYIDDIYIMQLVQYTCYQCCWSNNEDIILTCLQVLDTVVCYSNLPAESLPSIITTLCRKVNVEAYSQNCWKIMRNLLGTHMGHSTLYNMCRILQDPACFNDFTVLRGAIFYINMGLWGTKRVTSLKCTATSVLPSFLQALQCDHTVVVYEITLSIQRLVNKYGIELQDPAWDLVLSIMEKIALHVECKDDNKVAPVSTILHDTLSYIEHLVELKQFNGNIHKLFDLIELCSKSRPEPSVLRLITFLSRSIVPTRHEWLTKLDRLMDRYFKHETRTLIRIKALDVLLNVVSRNRHLYLDELIERSVMPYLQNMDCEQELAVRNKAAQLLIDICFECDSKKCLELLNILQRMLNRPFEQDLPQITNETDILDLKTIIVGLTKMLHVKIYQLPSTHAINIYKILVSYIDNHYKNISIMDYCPSIRHSIFECLLKLRANETGQIGFMESPTANIRFSPYLIIESKSHQERDRPSGTISPPPASPAPSPYPSCVVSTLSLVSASKVIVTALKIEKEWKIVSLLLQELPKVMQNKSLILNKYGNDVGLLADCLCSMVSDKSLNLPDSLRNLPPKMNRTEFQSYVFPVIASLASYHTHLEPSQQHRCIIVLEMGLASRCASQCIMALTTCTLEMRDAMYKLLPEVLLNLSKISATVHIAIPILEFLSTLTSLPKVFASFVGDQYMSVFAIALPYTNPFKYNHYTVSLSHHVIAVWFLKCRLPFRRDFVKFITTGLKSNVFVPFEEGQVLKADLSSLNEDSTSRKRSSSLTEQGSRRRDRPLPNSRLTELKPPIDESLMNFHVDLTETCIDLMARYTFSSCAVRPKRSPTVEFLLNGGQSMTWLLGHKLITVTTSGCSQKPLKNNLCDRCCILCKTDRYLISSDNKEEISLSRQNSTGKSNESNPHDTSGQSTAAEDKKVEVSKLEQLIFKNKSDENQPNKDLCACWCQGWAEIYCRRPTGDMSWVMRIQNETHFQSSSLDFPLADVTSLFLPTQSGKKTNISSIDRIQSPPDSDIDCLLDQQLENLTSNQMNQNVGILSISTSGIAASSNPVNIPGSPGKRTPSRQSSKESVDDLNEEHREEADCEADSLRDRSRNPVRRSNSSPEMSASWKNPFLKEKQLKYDEDADSSKPKQTYSIDMRVSCEAIPEEISGMGTTPPSNDSTPIDHVTTKPPPHSPNLDLQKANQKKLPNFQKTSLKRENLKLDSKMFLEKQFSLSIDVGGRVFVKAPLSVGELGKSESNRSINLDENRLDSIAPYVRDRSRTISVMSPTRKTRSDLEQLKKNTSTRNKDTPRSGVSPSFVFLQLYHSAHFGSTEEKPMLISQNPAIQRAIKALDFIPPFETHKVGVLYVGCGQACNETEILKNHFGSLRYAEFLQNLGTLINLKETDPQSLFLGGLDKNGHDGKFAYIWQDDVTQVIFHVATLMPTKESDPNCNAKKAHIGNDYVTIVYNESGDDYNIQTVKGQFNYANVVIQPLDNSTNRVQVKARDDLPDIIGHSEPKIISDQNLAILARQLALHANLASQVTRSIKTKDQDPYASNWLERLRKIKRLRTKVLQEVSTKEQDHKELLAFQSRSRKVEYMDDFTEYT